MKGNCGLAQTYIQELGSPGIGRMELVPTVSSEFFGNCVTNYAFTLAGYKIRMDRGPGSCFP